MWYMWLTDAIDNPPGLYCHFQFRSVEFWRDKFCFVSIFVSFKICSILIGSILFRSISSRVHFCFVQIIQLNKSAGSAIWWKWECLQRCSFSFGWSKIILRCSISFLLNATIFKNRNRTKLNETKLKRTKTDTGRNWTDDIERDKIEPVNVFTAREI